MSLTPDQFKFFSLTRHPEALIDGLLSSGDSSVFPSSSRNFLSLDLFNLNKGNGNDSSLLNLQENSARSPLLISGSSSLLHHIGEDDQWINNRDYRKSVLEGQLSGNRISKSVWTLKRKLAEVIAEKKGIEDTYSNPFRKANFTRCMSSRNLFGTGKVDNKEMSSVNRMHCGEGVCLTCSDKARARLAQKHFDRINAICEAQPGIDNIYHFVFTLPQELQSYPFESPDLEKCIKQRAVKILKRLFGGTQKSNLYMVAAVHPVSDSDLFTPRWHLHITVCPGEVVKPKSGDKFFRACKPQKTVNRYGKEMIDWEWLNGQWGSVLGDLFNHSGPVVVNTSFTPIKHPKFKQKLHHRLKYDLRSFGGDILSKFLRLTLDTEEPLVVFHQDKFVKGHDGNREYKSVAWRIETISAVVNQWFWIKKNNKIQGYGIALKFDLNSEIMGVEMEKEIEEKDGLVDVVTVCEIVDLCKWNEKKKVLEYKQVEIHQWEDPVDGELLFCMVDKVKSEKPIPVTPKFLKRWFRKNRKFIMH